MATSVASNRTTDTTGTKHRYRTNTNVNVTTNSRNNNGNSSTVVGNSTSSNSRNNNSSISNATNTTGGSSSSKTNRGRKYSSRTVPPRRFVVKTLLLVAMVILWCTLLRPNPPLYYFDPPYQVLDVDVDGHYDENTMTTATVTKIHPSIDTTRRQSNNSSNTSRSGSSPQLLPNCQPSASSLSVSSSTQPPPPVRWSSKAQLRAYQSTISTSKFNCFLNTTLCVYYYPADFFDADCGLGTILRTNSETTTDTNNHNNGRDLLHTLQQLQANNTLWNYGGQPGIGFPTLTMNQTCFPLDNDNDNEDAGNTTSAGAVAAQATPNHHHDLHYATTLQDIGTRSYTGSRTGTTTTCVTERITMLHVHKAGGSSLHAVFTNIAQHGRRRTTTTAYQKRHKFFTPSESVPGRQHRKRQKQDKKKQQMKLLQETTTTTNQRHRRLQHQQQQQQQVQQQQMHRGMAKMTQPPQQQQEPASTPVSAIPNFRNLSGSNSINTRVYEEALQDLRQHATTYPLHEYLPQQHIIIAIVRDPLSRFISSIGQALGAVGSALNPHGQHLLAQCVVDGDNGDNGDNVKEASTSIPPTTNNATQILSCIAQYILQHGYWEVDVHFTPQVLEISFATLYQDVPVGIFAFDTLPTVLEYFGQTNGQQYTKVRDGTTQGYRKHPVLSSMTVHDYNADTIRMVCTIYELDVRMLRSLGLIGLEVPLCDPYLPK